MPSNGKHVPAARHDGPPFSWNRHVLYDGGKRGRGMFDLTIDREEPQRFFLFRWHPFAIDPNIDYSAEPTTLVASYR
jgi:hypothetical protein